MPKRRTNNLFPVKVYDTIQSAARSKSKLSSNNTKHIIPIQASFQKGDKSWEKTMYINTHDLSAYRQDILGVMTQGMNKYHDKANKKVIYSTRDKLGNLERQVRGCIQIENKKKGLHQEVVDQYYQEDESLKAEYAKKKIEELKSRFTL